MMRKDNYEPAVALLEKQVGEGYARNERKCFNRLLALFVSIIC